jgi:non-specific serine/threonine protein kinase
VVPLGSYQLRGFATTARLFQLHHPDLPAEFPPLRAIGIVDHNLPFLRAGFVGRGSDRIALAELLRTTGVVSVVGPGGVGKTRLAIQVAFDIMDRFGDGAWLVELALATDAMSVARAVATTLGVAEQPGSGIEAQLVEALRSKSALIILDNCEHLLDAIAPLAERLSQQCPQLVILTTSREPLDIDGEVVWRLQPLQTVQPQAAPEEIAASEAVQLFAQRAKLVTPGFELTDDNAADVARIVSSVNGLPLAIELAAAALGERSLTGVLSGLSDRFSLLTRGRRTAPSRHQTLRAALEWSLDLLRPEERVLFGRLAVFAGGATVDAVSRVCAGGLVVEAQIPSLVRHLARASLLTTQADAPDRWSMLESVRELAALELNAAGESDQFASRHRTWVAERVEAVEKTIGRRGKGSVMSDLAADQDNVRRAIENALAQRDAETALRISSAMAPFWTSHGDWSEGSNYLEQALRLDGDSELLRGRAQVALGSLLLLRGELTEAEVRFEEARASASPAEDDVTIARALAGEGYVSFRHSDLPTAQARWEEALECAERSGDERVAANVLRSLAIAAGTNGEQARAGDLIERAIASAERAEDDQLLRQLLGSSAEIHLWLGRYQTAESLYGEALAIATAIGDISARSLLVAELGWIALLRGDPTTAERLASEAGDLAEDLDSARVHAHALRLRGEALVRMGGGAQAAVFLDRALSIAEDLDAPAEVAGVRCSQACLALDRRALGEARRFAEQAIELSALGHTMRRTNPGWVLGVASLLERDLDGARRRFRDGVTQAREAQIRRHEANHLWGLASTEAAAGDLRLAADLHGQALRVRGELGDRLGLVDSLVGVAATAARAEPETAAWLLAAATSLRTRAGAVATEHEATLSADATAAIDASGGSGAIDATLRDVDLTEAEVVATAQDLMAKLSR